MTPAMNKPMASNDVPTGRRMNGGQTFMRGQSRNPNTESRRKPEARKPNLPSRGDAPVFAHSGQSRRDCISQPSVARHELPWVQPTKASSTLKGLYLRLAPFVLAATQRDEGPRRHQTMQPLQG